MQRKGSSRVKSWMKPQREPFLLRLRLRVRLSSIPMDLSLELNGFSFRILSLMLLTGH